MTTNKPSAAAVRAASAIIGNTDRTPAEDKRVTAAVDAEIQPLIEALEQATTDLAEASKHFEDDSLNAVVLRRQAREHLVTLKHAKGEQ